jgi:hypothetical protein
LGVLEGFLAEYRAEDQKGIRVLDDHGRRGDLFNRDLEKHQAGMGGAYAGGEDEHGAPDPLPEKLVVPVAKLSL